MSFGGFRIQQMKRLAIAFAFGTALLGPLAHANDADDFNLAGSWTINVDDNEACEFNGRITIKPMPDGNYEGELTMRHACPSFIEEYIVRQKATISVMRNQVSVRSEIIEFLSGTPAEGYAPDNFALTIQSANRLFGVQTDRWGTEPAEWVRQASGIS